MKKKATAVIAACMAIVLTACIGSFDASKYVEGALKNIYLGDASTYMELVDITEDEAAAEYESGIEVEADFFLQYCGIPSVSDDVYQQIVDMYKNIYQHSKFEVQEAVKNGNDYNVEVLISPIDIIVKNTDAISTTIDDFVATMNPDDYADEQSAYDAVMVSIVDLINADMENLGYEDEISVIVKVEQDENGYYGLSSDAIGQLDQEIIAY